MIDAHSEAVAAQRLFDYFKKIQIQSAMDEHKDIYNQKIDQAKALTDQTLFLERMHYELNNPPPSQEDDEYDEDMGNVLYRYTIGLCKGSSQPAATDYDPGIFT